ncbi:MAG: carboxypeptidase-like regulatory domain-containing protein [Phocaeicola sp.]
MNAILRKLAIVSFLILQGLAIFAQQNSFFTLTGKVKDQQTKRLLANVNIAIEGDNVGTVTNSDGVFSIKLPQEYRNGKLKFSHLGYLNLEIDISESQPPLLIYLTPYTNTLKEVVIFGGDPRILVEEALKKVSINYADRENMLTSFYRETVQKGKRYIALSEAVMDIYKSAYGTEEIARDKVRITKGRRLMSQKSSDTLAIKMVGGPTLAVTVDVVKNPETLFEHHNLNYYSYRMEDPVTIDNQMHYVVSFEPRVQLDYALFGGKFYIDTERLSISRAEFSLDMTNKLNATRAILHKKPAGLHFKPQELTFLITYKESNGSNYLYYIRNTVRFKCDWKRKMFSSTYTILTETVVTDREEEHVSRIPSKDAFSEKHSFVDKVDSYWHPDFWGNYNIIEPTESLEHAVTRLRKK